MLSVCADDATWTTDEELAALTEWVEGRKAIVEVGTWKGRAAYALALGMADGRLWCVDDFSGDPDRETCKRFFPQALTAEGRAEVKAEWYERMAGFSHCAALVERDSLSAARLFDPRSTSEGILAHSDPLDLVFLDGCHRYESIAADLDAWMPLIAKGGLLCGHDWNHPDVLRALLERLTGQLEFGPGKLWRTRTGRR